MTPSEYTCSRVSESRAALPPRGEEVPRPRRIIRAARVGDAARRKRIKLQSGRASWREVAIDVEHYVGRIGDVDIDSAVGFRPEQSQRWL